MINILLGGLYMNKICNKIYDNFLTIVGDIKFFKYPMFIIYDPSEYGVTGDDMDTIQHVIQPGDILLRAYSYYVDGLFIPSQFSHAAFYKGRGIGVHAIGEGVRPFSLLEFLRCDAVAVLRFKNITQQQIQIAIDNANALIGKPYDFEFESDDDEYYCSELITYIYKHMLDKLQVVPRLIRPLKVLKRIAILPDDLATSPAINLVYANSVGKKKCRKLGINFL